MRACVWRERRGGVAVAKSEVEKQIERRESKTPCHYSFLRLLASFRLPPLLPPLSTMFALASTVRPTIVSARSGRRSVVVRAEEGNTTPPPAPVAPESSTPVTAAPAAPAMPSTPVSRDESATEGLSDLPEGSPPGRSGWKGPARRRRRNCAREKRKPNSRTLPAFPHCRPSSPHPALPRPPRRSRR